MLFNVYLEEAIKSSSTLEDLRSRGDLLAFPDDMLVCSNSQAEITKNDKGDRGMERTVQPQDQQEQVRGPIK